MSPFAPARRRLPARLAPVAFSFYMSALVSLMMCLTLTAWNTGVGSGYLLRVAQAYAVSWPVAFFGVLLVRPLVVKLVGFTVDPPAPPRA